MARHVPGVGEYLFDEARRAVSDIRHKLFEEAWFGRTMRAEQSQSLSPIYENKEQSGPASFEEAWSGKPRDHGEGRERELRPEQAPELER
jgi:hypothetical protein